MNDTAAYSNGDIPALRQEIAELTAKNKELVLALGELRAEKAEPYFGWCDVDGCEIEGCSGGNAWRETGYWTVCYKHADDYRNGLDQPKMKKESVEKEASRDPKTGWLPSKSKKTTPKDGL